MELDLDKLNDCLMAGLKSPLAQNWVDRCFQNIHEFEDSHSRVDWSLAIGQEEDPRVKCWGGKISKQDVLITFHNDLYYQLKKRSLL